MIMMAYFQPTRPPRSDSHYKVVSGPRLLASSHEHKNVCGPAKIFTKILAILQWSSLEQLLSSVERNKILKYLKSWGSYNSYISLLKPSQLGIHNIIHFLKNLLSWDSNHALLTPQAIALPTWLHKFVLEKLLRRVPWTPPPGGSKRCISEQLSPPPSNSCYGVLNIFWCPHQYEINPCLPHHPVQDLSIILLQKTINPNTRRDRISKFYFVFAIYHTQWEGCCCFLLIRSSNRGVFYSLQFSDRFLAGLFSFFA